MSEVLKHAGGWLGNKTVEKADKVKRGFAWAWRACLDSVKQAGAWCLTRLAGLAACALNLPGRLKAAGWLLWQFRRTSSVAAGVGLAAGFGSYLAGPLTAAVLCGACGAVLCVAGMILVPLARLLISGGECAA